MSLVVPPSDLVVCLAVQRHGADWPQVAGVVGSVLGALGYAGAAGDALGAAECEALYQTHSSGEATEVALATLVGELTARRITHLTSSAATLRAQAEVTAAVGDGDERGRSGPHRARAPGPVDAHGPDAEAAVDPWVDLAEEERNPRRASVQGTLLKFVQSIMRHKWAHPFKRPVTDKEAPDYKDIVRTPMDFATLRKRVESGLLHDLAALVRDLNLIFDNAMLYNPAKSDYHKMASTLKDVREWPNCRPFFLCVPVIRMLCAAFLLCSYAGGRMAIVQNRFLSMAFHARRSSVSRPTCTRPGTLPRRSRRDPPTRRSSTPSQL